MMISCADCQKGTKGTIANINGDQFLRSRLRAMGVKPGATLNIVRRSPFGDPIEIAVSNTHLALRKEQAACIMLQPS